MKIIMAQLNPIVGDIKGNTEKLMKTVEANANSDLVIFPEMFITGYPPRDLLEKHGFIERTEKAVASIAGFSKRFPETGILFGTPLKNSGEGLELHNAAILMLNGKKLLVQYKSLLPTYDVFDEARYFEPAKTIDVVDFRGEKLGISVCEDAWNNQELLQRNHYTTNPIDVLAKKGATLMINISASPFHLEKEKVRFRLISAHAKRYKVPFVYVNQIGANDEIIFDGRSIFVDASGQPVKVLPAFEESVMTADTDASGSAEYKPDDVIETLEKALVLGIKDYFRKCGFTKAVVGLSGGIDSAVTCALAVRALGKNNVTGISMPSKFSSEGSIVDSKALAENLGIDFRVIPIKEIHDAYLKTLSAQFRGTKAGITEENIQARIRGNILMAFSNKFGHIVLSTGNKSEMAVGYCTLYGDMSGGLSVISDVPKTMVYRLAEYINRNREVIPKSTMTKPPSAELRPEQKDQDTLPPYDILDDILHHYIDEGASSDELKKKGFDASTVDWVVKAVNRNEYKRKQAAPGLKVTSKAFGQGRRIPIAAKHE